MGPYPSECFLEAADVPAALKVAWNEQINRIIAA